MILHKLFACCTTYQEGADVDFSEHIESICGYKKKSIVAINPTM